MKGHPATDVPQLRPATWPAIVSYFAAFVLAFTATTALVFGVALSRSSGRAISIAFMTDEATRFALSAPGIMACALVSASMIATVTVVAARLQARDIVSTLRLAATRASFVGIVAAVVGMVGLSLATGAASDLLGLRGQGTMAAIARALERPPPARLLIAIVTIAIAPAVAEEGLFRGLIQTRLAARWGRWPSILITALGFGLVHLDLVQGAVAAVAGIFLGWIADRFGGIRPTIAAHAFNNAAFVAVAAVGSTGDVTRMGDVALTAGGLMTWILAVVLLRSDLAIRPDTATSPRE
ncbi:MAG: CPBP family intramembrane metalloprotease [Myxococcota bacterium]|nr:CPBP family intramembrane metalloprotease [Myxococcota bacterium]